MSDWHLLPQDEENVGRQGTFPDGIEVATRPQLRCPPLFESVRRGWVSITHRFGRSPSPTTGPCLAGGTRTSTMALNSRIQPPVQMRRMIWQTKHMLLAPTSTNKRSFTSVRLL